MDETYPYADDLRRKIEAGGAPGFLFETWAYRDGLGKRDSYEWMQGRLEDGYDRLGARLGMDVVPVGNAWYGIRKAEVGARSLPRRRQAPQPSRLVRCRLCLVRGTNRPRSDAESLQRGAGSG